MVAVFFFLDLCERGQDGVDSEWEFCRMANTNLDAGNCTKLALCRKIFNELLGRRSGSSSQI